MPSELTQAIQQVCDDKKIPLKSVVETIESALGAAYRKDFGNKLQNIKVEFNMDTGGFKVFDIKEVVEDELKETYEKLKEERMKAIEQGIELKTVGAQNFEPKENEEEVKKFNPKTMIGLTDAKEIKKKAKINEELIQELEVPGDFGRMAAQTAKQVVIQKLREAEKDTIFNEYKDKQGELIKGTIQRREGNVVLIDLANTTAVMPITESIRDEKYLPAASFKFYIKSVEQGQRGPEIVLSRVNPEILRKLFKLEVPEISSGTVVIKSIAREAGSRSKIAVMAKEDSIDPIGSCVGQRGTRVQTIINELGGEKIDIIEWEEDPSKFIAKALAPAKVLKVEIKNHEEAKDDKKKKKEKTDQVETQDLASNLASNITSDENRREAIVSVNEDQLSLAIGKEGQNVRLAAKLTGWKIDIIGIKTENNTTDDNSTDSSEESSTDDTQEIEKQKIKGEEKTVEEEKKGKEEKVEKKDKKNKKKEEKEEEKEKK